MACPINFMYIYSTHKLAKNSLDPTDKSNVHLIWSWPLQLSKNVHQKLYAEVKPLHQKRKPWHYSLLYTSQKQYSSRMFFFLNAKHSEFEVRAFKCASMWIKTKIINFWRQICMIKHKKITLIYAHINKWAFMKFSCSLSYLTGNLLRPSINEVHFDHRPKCPWVGRGG